MKQKRTGLKIGVSQILIGLALALAISSFAAAKKYIVYFPFGLGNEVLETKGYKLQDEVTNAVKAGLMKSSDIAVTTFSRTHSSVKRALAEGTLKSTTLLEPFNDQVDGQYKAITLGKLLRGDMSVAGMIEDFSYDEQKKVAKLVVSVDVFDLKASRLLGAVVLTSVGAGDTEVEAAKQAASKFADMVVPQIISAINRPIKKDK